MPDIVIQAKSGGQAVNGLTDDPEITILRLDTDAVVVNADAMTDQGAGGLYKYAFEPLPGVNYSFSIDADPNSTGQTDDLFYHGAFSNPIEYTDGAVWVDSTSGNTNTRIGIDGTQDNPVNSIAVATTIANALGIQRIKIIRGNFTLTQEYQGWEFLSSGPAGAGSSVTKRINLGGEDHSGSRFEGLFIIGDADSPNGIIQFTHCALSGVTNLRCQADFCGIQGDISIVNDSFFQNCYSRTAGGSTPSIDCNGSDLNMRAYSGGLEIRGVTGGAVSAEFIAGQCIIAASCTAGDIQVRGVVSPVTDNSAGSTVTTVAAVQGIHLDDIWQNEGLDPDNSKTITENTPGSDYDEAVGSINKSVTKVGAVTTIDRA